MTVYYASPTGNDSNSGLDTSHAWQTLTKVKTSTAAGDTVIFADGTYIGQVTLTAAGTALAPITLKAQNKWGAKLYQSATHGVGSYILVCNGDYTIIDSFE